VLVVQRINVINVSLTVRNVVCLEHLSNIQEAAPRTFLIVGFGVKCGDDLVLPEVCTSAADEEPGKERPNRCVDY
jgi:hypothetical protein